MPFQWIAVSVPPAQEAEPTAAPEEAVAAPEEPETAEPADPAI